jgi:surface antigen
MKRNLVFLVAAGLILSACSSHVSKSTDEMQVASNSTGGLTEATSNAPVAGSAQHSMDSFDRTKLYRALDGGIGKATSWVNANTGITYTVVPTEKLSIGGNPFCRKYTVSSEKGASKNEINGTACVSTDGAWHPA